MGLKMSQNLKHRLSIGLMTSVVLMGLIFASYQPFMPLILTLCLAAVIGCALWEYYHIAEAKGFRPLVKFGIVFSSLYLLVNFWSLYSPSVAVWLTILLGIGFLLGFLYFFFRDRNPLINLAISSFGIAYLTIPLSYMLNINYFFSKEGPQDGRWWLFYLLAVTKMTDTGAFFVGKLFGKTPLAKHISPKKTMEGAAGGMMAAIFVSFLIPFIAHFLSPGAMHITAWECLILGALIGLLGEIGDLGESLLKRDAGVKDSNQIPGLGGLLDIVDSLIFTTPIVYFFLYFREKGGFV